MSTLEESFAEFVKANPAVVEDIRRRALDAKQRGKKTGRMKQFYEDVRDSALVADDGKPYKLNNSHTSLMARLLMDQEPTLRGFFRTRALHHELREVPAAPPTPSAPTRDSAAPNGDAGEGPASPASSRTAPSAHPSASAEAVAVPRATAPAEPEPTLFDLEAA